MIFKIVSIGTKPPTWVREGFQAYADRMPRDFPILLREVAAPKHLSDSAQTKSEEAKRLNKEIDPQDFVVALDERGHSMHSRDLASQVLAWQEEGQRQIVFLIGGADGLAAELKARANMLLSLSSLTYPHYMVRIVLAEAIYRAWTIQIGHPYHRD